MERELAYLLCNIAQEWGAEIDETYSGRNMYGDTTHAVILDGSGTEILLNVLEAVQDGSLTEADLEGIKLGRLVTDSMGLGMVIY